ncbi:nuclease [Pokkaliibacter plantistimulans]|uniref:Nuclease n=1 Tax=Pokkaliibacter plantistimulans TaxID=1635171 RepID=A0ABX5M4J2_9GAMM|nr:thermonuclease family protein [Pokkaliibacter plantistimulans]PXF32613.1 nuclease [Pokkaliibacter plantistimulans]
MLSLRRILLCATALLVSFSVHSAPREYGTVRVSEVTSIYDADTFTVNIQNWPGIVGERVPVRVYGIDAPEIKGQCPREKNLAQQAKQVTVAALRRARVIELRHLQRDKYFRILADVYIDNVKLADLLINKRLAYPYFGETKQKWC